MNAPLAQTLLPATYFDDDTHCCCYSLCHDRHDDRSLIPFMLSYVHYVQTLHAYLYRRAHVLLRALRLRDLMFLPLDGQRVLLMVKMGYMFFYHCLSSSC